MPNRFLTAEEFDESIRKCCRIARRKARSMAKGMTWRNDVPPAEEAVGGKRPLTKISITGDGKNFNVTHHYEDGGSSGMGSNYYEKPYKYVTGEDMLSHVKVHSARLGKSAPKDERPEEDNYDAQGGNENER